MMNRRKSSVTELVMELRRHKPRPDSPLARWRQARFDRKLGRINHLRLLRAYYGKEQA